MFINFYSGVKMYKSIFGILVFLSFGISFDLGACEDLEYLTSFKIGSNTYSIKMDGDSYAKIVGVHDFRLHLKGVPISIAYQDKSVLVLRSSMPDSRHCAYGYHIVSSQGDYLMVSGFIPTCVNPEEDEVFRDEHGAVHIEVKSELAESIKSVLYQHGKLQVVSALDDSK